LLLLLSLIIFILTLFFTITYHSPSNYFLVYYSCSYPTSTCTSPTNNLFLLLSASSLFSTFATHHTHIALIQITIFLHLLHFTSLLQQYSFSLLFIILFINAPNYLKSLNKFFYFSSLFRINSQTWFYNILINCIFKGFMKQVFTFKNILFKLF
jgi:hypothetical protein